MAASHERHWRALEQMYHSAPINEFFRPEMRIGPDETTIRMHVRRDFFHAANALHGAAYFKMLDDATFFAVSAQVSDVFVLTGTFTITLRKPVTGGIVIATGRVTGQEGRRIMADGVLVDDAGATVAEGSGVFVRSKIALTSIDAYRRFMERPA